ncbi:isoleucine--tRNA ligase [Candidatus Hepatobacter penaei]|uniref:isoleucine--tRNA ligase n=1 Tax=Candidatus Hepatobacter penaei TaxID=1274402 RepID=UPI0004F25557|nr:isoleucine--tRNA ligase [Candidatus Hepatobacter penaei]
MTTPPRDLSVFLPKTSFGMRGFLSKKEPEMLAFWRDIQLEEKRRTHNKHGQPFILHDGPPYANGHLHLGHAVNKIAKDIINRFWWMQGRSIAFRPGWDCHGLPIEAKVEEAFRKQGQEKKDVAPLAFRKACRAFAQKWIEIQRDEFKRMGLSGPFDDPYTTMTPDAEAAIVRSFLDLVEQQQVYRGLKPVLWSPVEETALAEAEVEYKDVTSHTVFAGLPFTDQAPPTLQGAKALIWTTTPWTLPANRAVAYGDFPYVAVRITQAADPTIHGQTYVMAAPCVKAVCEVAGVTSYEEVARLTPHDLEGLYVRHPLFHQGYDITVPLLKAAYVTADTGTGLVHTAPDHGLEDFSLGQEHNLPLADLLRPNGVFKDHVPLVGGHHLYKVAPVVIEALKQEGTLFHHDNLRHSYPHSWRSKTPLIYRATPQWFLRLDGTPSLRQQALNAIKRVQFFPASGQNRLTAMVESRPDWCLSRQRTWGVPLMLFIHQDTGDLLVDPRVNAHMVARVKDEGCDFWWDTSAEDLLAPFGLHGYAKVTDIVDVWFESGLTQAFVLNDSLWPADLYLEGSDQHRGWFQSSLVLGCALRGGAPFKALLTHGFLTDGDGQKMSKSGGNNVSPQEIIQEKGADLLRLWTASANIYEDIKFSPNAFKSAEDTYRRLRNTFRFLLGNLADTTPLSCDLATLDFLDAWMLARLDQVHRGVVEALSRYNPGEAVALIHHFCNTDLSSFYFDVRKDVLYCEGQDSPQRQHCLFVLWHLLRHTMMWIAPFLPFTAEDIFQTAKQELPNLTHDWPESVHLMHLPTPNAAWQRDDLLTDMAALRDMRKHVTHALEHVRAQGDIRSSLEAHPQLIVTDADLERLCQRLGTSFLATLCITSSCSLHKRTEAPEPSSQDNAASSSGLLWTAAAAEGIHIAIHRADGDKCERCWRFEALNAQSLCPRCAEVVGDVYKKAT